MNRLPNALLRRVGLVALAGLIVVSGIGFPGEARAADNSRRAWDFFVGKGLTAEQTAGVLGNLAQESNINPLAQEPGGPGRGIAQWSTGGRWDTTASANATWYATVTGQNVWSLDAQLGFIWWELTNISGYGLAQLRASSTIADATVAFQDLYERCGTCHESTRISYATNYYNQYAGTTPPASNTQVFETADNSGWQPLPVASIVASKVSAVLRADGTKIIYSVRDGYVYEAASNAGWRNLRVPNLDNVSAVSAIAFNGGTVLYTIRAGAVWESSSVDWRPYAVGYNGSPIYADSVSAVLRADGTRIVYTMRDGYVYEAGSNAGWRNLRVPTLSGVSALSAIPYDGGTVLYTIRAGAVWEAGSGNWTPYAVGYNGSPLYGSGLSAISLADGTRIVYTVNNGRVYEAASNAGWRNLQVPNLSGVNSVSAVNAGGTKILYTR
ncbi:hypothetical protein GA0074692_2759 [Micromonospora pallida]|uniref:Phage tail lysozyme domain-containing protein n=1 Tax=Micromonospora pallida TaxID=145854 RepID=A0A1C6SJP7_9ACTN|nr:phage tail tip lysozyme [Micromonospora pallida]SCL29605.1 hypothetical protein GA0074692_2759 [Micromonospora pallida]